MFPATEQSATVLLVGDSGVGKVLHKLIARLLDRADESSQTALMARLRGEEFPRRYRVSAGVKVDTLKFATVMLPEYLLRSRELANTNVG